MSAQQPTDFDSVLITRRRLLQVGAGAVGVAGITALLAACGGDEAAAPAPPAEPPPAEPAPAEPTPAEPTPAEPAPAQPSPTPAEPAPAEPTPAEPAPTPAEPARGGEIKLAISDAFSTDSLDPLTNFSVLGIMAGGMLYDQLVTMDDQWNLSARLAEDWEMNADGTEWSFRLRDGVEFHSGKTLTSADVAYVMRRNLDESTGGGAFNIYSPVLDPDGIETPDPTTIRFKLKAADAFFGIKVGHWYGHIYEENTDFSTSPGTGPFKSETFKGGEGFQFVRHENYWMDGLPYLDGISGVVTTELATKTQAVVSGDTHLVDPPAWSGLDQFEQSDNIEALTSPFFAAFVFGIDGTAGPYTDPRVRTAVKMLIDRPRFVDVVTRGNGTVSADSAIHPNDPFYPQDLEPPVYDPEQAKALLKEAGAEGFEETLFTSDCCPGLLDGAVLLQEALAAGGINAKVENRTFDDLFTKNFLVDRVVANYWLRQHPSTMLPFMYQSKGIWNESRFSDPEVDQWILDAQAAVNPDDQKRIYGDIIRRYAETSSSIWPFHMHYYWPHKKELQGLAIHPVYNMEFRNAHLIV